MAGITTPWDDHYMLPAFLGCVRWALGNDDIVASFRKETGGNLSADFDSMQRFSNWVAENVFGKPEDLEET